jgi:hypothetical protein
VIGAHTPEFSFEHELDRVRQATSERAIDYPVAVDNGYEIWSTFDTHYWPALYFVDTDGVIRDQHFGEGRYEQSERVSQRLLGVEREPVSVEGLGVEAEADWDNLRMPEAYLGSGRGEHFASPDGAAFDERRAYESPGPRGPIPFRLLLDGEAPRPSHGVDEDGNGLLREGRLYQLVHQHDRVRERTLEITFLEPGAEAYAFTFG